MRKHWCLPALLLCACATRSSPPATQEVAVNTIQVSESDAGKTITAKQGGTIAVQLDENPTTGYQWKLQVEPPGPWQLVTTSFSPPLDGRVGGGGTRTWLLQAVHGGQAHLAFELRRRWGDEKPLKRLDFELMAQ
jgi:inhibitor of cysteine peptidase